MCSSTRGAPIVAAPRYASPVYIWDTATDVITAVTSGGNDGQPNCLSRRTRHAGIRILAESGLLRQLRLGWRAMGDAVACRAAVAWDLISPVLTPKQRVFQRSLLLGQRAAERPGAGHQRDVSVRQQHGRPGAPGTTKLSPSRPMPRPGPAPACGGSPITAATCASDANPAGLEFWYLATPECLARWPVGDLHVQLGEDARHRLREPAHAGRTSSCSS